MTELAARFGAHRALRIAIWSLVALGITIRIAQWTGNLSLDMAEAGVNLNVLERTPAALLGPLDRDQAAPVGFLLAQKLVVESWNERELALRLFPLLCGVVALAAFPLLARRSVGDDAALVAVALFAFLGGSDWMPLAASRIAKQYAGDMAAAVLLLLWATRVARRGIGLGGGVLFGLGGAAGLAFSHPAAFVLSAAGTVLAIDALRRGDRRSLAALVTAGVLWAAAFAGLYVLSLRHASANEYLLHYWSPYFAPLPPARAVDLHWFFDAFVRLFDRETAGFRYPGLAAFLATLGFAALWTADRRQSLLLATPAIPALLASAARLYPFGHHLALFLVPSLLLFVGEGVASLRRAAGAHGRVVLAVVCVFLLYRPLLTDNRLIFVPTPYQEARPVVEHLAAGWRPGDRLFVYVEARYPFEYYARELGFHPDDVVFGRSDDRDWDEDWEDMAPLRGHPRVWLLFHDPEGGVAHGNEEEFFLAHLDLAGRRLDSFRGVDASVHLYALDGGGAQ